MTKNGWQHWFCKAVRIILSNVITLPSRNGGGQRLRKCRRLPDEMYVTK